MTELYYIPTRPAGVPVLILANTALYNQLNVSTAADVVNTGYIYSDFDTACAALKDAFRSALGASKVPTVWTGPSANASPALADMIATASNYFNYIHKADQQTDTGQTLGNSYGPISYKSTLYSGNNNTDYYTTPNVTAGNRYGDYRVYIATQVGTSFLIHVIPEAAISERKTFISANLGTHDISITAQTLNLSGSWGVRIQRSMRATGDTISRYLLNNVALESATDPDTDPYTDAGYPESTAPGGSSGGSFDFTEDGLSGVHTPTLDILNCGLVTAWRPSKATLAQLSQWLWTTTPGQIIQQLFGNPINAIIGLHIVPVSPDVDSGSSTIKFGAEDSGVACHKITSQHVTVDCGSLKITHKYGSYMDYAPQASAEIFLPYVGGMPLDVNDVIDKTLSVRYKVDVLSGACVAYVFVDGVLHYQKSGCCAATAPITGSQMPNVVSGVLSIVGSVAGAVASMGASGAGTAAKVASGIATGTSVAESAANMMKQSISYSGTVSGWAGLLGAQKPYVILTLPNAAIPGGQNTLMGYPAWVSGKVGDFRGYTECSVDRIYSYRATDQEVEEIKNLMAGGVVL